MLIVGLWLIGVGFTAGLLYASLEEKPLKAKVVGFLFILVAWPVFLGDAIGGKPKREEGRP